MVEKGRYNTEWCENKIVGFNFQNIDLQFNMYDLLHDWLYNIAEFK